MGFVDNFLKLSYSPNNFSQQGVSKQSTKGFLVVVD